MKVSLEQKKTQAQVIVEFVESDKGLASLPKSTQVPVKKAFKEGLITNESGSSWLITPDKGPDYLVMVADKKLNVEKLRVLAAKTFKVLSSKNYKNIQVNGSKCLGSEPDCITGITEGFVLADYKFVQFKKKDKKIVEIQVSLGFTKNKANADALKDALIVAETTNFTRFLGDCPGNFMTPTQLAKEAQNIAKGTSMKVSVWNKAQIQKQKMESLIGVSNGSVEEPRFIIMEYKGTSAKKKPVCLVGKGLTFDCGGISIKPSAGMQEMKYDMCGGAAVIGAMGAIAKLKLKVNVIAYVPASENMPGAAANKPGDIRPARNGTTIEINNTDAEGRLILADALCYASEKKPAVIFDTATLTGAMVVALGNIHTGFYTRDEKLVQKVIASGEKSGEKLWPMPLVDDHSKDMRGTFADLTNLAPSRGAGSATAAAFLENFVGDDIPWVHFDIAGTGWNVGNRLAYAPSKGASGVLVRTFIELVKSYS